MTVQIPRNTTIPTRKVETYSTAADNQPGVEIHVMQGSASSPRTTRSLGKIQADGIRGSARTPQIEVTFDIRRQRHPERERERQGHEQGTEDHHHRFERPDQEEAEKMKTSRSAQRRRPAPDGRGRGAQPPGCILYQSEKDAPRKSREDRGGGREEGRRGHRRREKAINEGGVARLRSATENVERSLHKIAEELYKTSQAAGAAGAGRCGGGAGAAGFFPGSSGAQGEKAWRVIDAEYVDVDETKRPN